MPTKRTLVVVALLIMMAVVVAVRISQPPCSCWSAVTSCSASSRRSCWSVRAAARPGSPAPRLARAQAVQAIPAMRTVLAEDAAPADDEREVLAELGVEDEPVRAGT